MAARKVLIGVAVLALGGGVLASVANAAPLCGSKACSDEADASGLTDVARRACLKSLISDCKAGLCSCTGGSLPCSCVCGDGLCGPSEDCSTCPQDCGTCPTTTTSTSSTSTTIPPPCAADRECAACGNTTDCGGSGTCFVVGGTTCEHRGEGNVCVSRLGIVCDRNFCNSDADCGPKMVCIVDKGSSFTAPMCCPPCP
jgi:hypothetical protein